MSDLKQSNRWLSNLSLRLLDTDSESATNETKSNFKSVLATSKATKMWDYDTWEMVDEVLDINGVANRTGETWPLLDSHSRWSVDDIVGRVSLDSVEDEQLVGTLSFDTGGDKGSECARKVAAGMITDVSIGYKILSVEKVKAGVNAKVGNRVLQGPVNIVRSWQVFEVSVVPIGADSDAKIMRSLFAGRQGNNGVNITPKSKPEATNMPTGDTPETEVTPAQVTARAIADERKRSAQIIALAEEYSKRFSNLPDNFVAEHTEKGSTVDAVRATLLDLAVKSTAVVPSTTPPAIVPKVEVTRNNGDEVLSAVRDYGHLAVRQRFGKRVDLTGVSELGKTVVAKLRNMSMLDTFRYLEVVKGRAKDYVDTLDMPSQTIASEILGSFRQMTTDALPKYFTNALNAELLDPDMPVEVSWDKVFTQDTLLDLREKEFMKLGTTPRLNKSGEGQTVTFYEFSERGEKYKLVKYDGGLRLTEEMIINDRWDALLDQATTMAMYTEQQIDETAWAVFMANAALSDSVAFFDSTRGNYYDGTGTALSDTALANAYEKFLTQYQFAAKDHTNKKKLLNALPKQLIVPPALRKTALELLNSTAAVGQANPNTFNAARVGLDPTPLVVPYLQLSEYTNYSSKAWYIAADKRYKYAVVGFLNGQRRPSVSQDVEFTSGAIRFVMKLWWEAKMLQPEYIHKHKGEA